MPRMDEISTVDALIRLWPNRQALADDIKVPVDRVHKWAGSGAIPAKYHFGVLRAAGARGYPVTSDLIIRLHACDGEAAA